MSSSLSSIFDGDLSISTDPSSDEPAVWRGRPSSSIVSTPDTPSTPVSTRSKPVISPSVALRTTSYGTTRATTTSSLSSLRVAANGAVAGRTSYHSAPGSRQPTTSNTTTLTTATATPAAVVVPSPRRLDPLATPPTASPRQISSGDRSKAESSPVVSTAGHALAAESTPPLGPIAPPRSTLPSPPMTTTATTSDTTTATVPNSPARVADVPGQTGAAPATQAVPQSPASPVAPNSAPNAQPRSNQAQRSGNPFPMEVADGSCSSSSSSSRSRSRRRKSGSGSGSGKKDDGSLPDGSGHTQLASATKEPVPSNKKPWSFLDSDSDSSDSSEAPILKREPVTLPLQSPIASTSTPPRPPLPAPQVRTASGQAATAAAPRTSVARPGQDLSLPSPMSSRPSSSSSASSNSSTSHASSKSSDLFPEPDSASLAPTAAAAAAAAAATTAPTQSPVTTNPDPIPSPLVKPPVVTVRTPIGSRPMTAGDVEERTRSPPPAFQSNAGSTPTRTVTTPISKKGRQRVHGTSSGTKMIGGNDSLIWSSDHRPVSAPMRQVSFRSPSSMYDSAASNSPSYGTAGTKKKRKIKRRQPLTDTEHIAALQVALELRTASVMKVRARVKELQSRQERDDYRIRNTKGQAHERLLALRNEATFLRDKLKGDLGELQQEESNNRQLRHRVQLQKQAKEERLIEKARANLKAHQKQDMASPEAGTGSSEAQKNGKQKKKNKKRRGSSSPSSSTSLLGIPESEIRHRAMVNLLQVKSGRRDGLETLLQQLEREKERSAQLLTVSIQKGRKALQKLKKKEKPLSTKIHRLDTQVRMTRRILGLPIETRTPVVPVSTAPTDPALPAHTAAAAPAGAVTVVPSPATTNAATHPSTSTRRAGRPQSNGCDDPASSSASSSSRTSPLASRHVSEPLTQPASDPMTPVTPSMTSTPPPAPPPDVHGTHRSHPAANVIFKSPARGNGGGSIDSRGDANGSGNSIDPKASPSRASIAKPMPSRPSPVSSQPAPSSTPTAAVSTGQGPLLSPPPAVSTTVAAVQPQRQRQGPSATSKTSNPFSLMGVIDDSSSSSSGSSDDGGGGGGGVGGRRNGNGHVASVPAAREDHSKTSAFVVNQRALSSAAIGPKRTRPVKSRIEV